MREDKMGRGFGSNSLEVDAVPGWSGRGEDTWFWTQLGLCVVTYSKAITCRIVSILRTR